MVQVTLLMRWCFLKAAMMMQSPGSLPRVYCKGNNRHLKSIVEGSVEGWGRPDDDN
jgi:hypothetical protein